MPRLHIQQGHKKIMERKRAKQIIKRAVLPVQYVSVDSFESTMAVFSTQLKGVLTNKWNSIATIYIDNYFDLSNTFLQEDASSKDTLKGKLALKQK